MKPSQSIGRPFLPLLFFFCLAMIDLPVMAQQSSWPSVKGRLERLDTAYRAAYGRKDYKATEATLVEMAALLSSVAIGDERERRQTKEGYLESYMAKNLYHLNCVVRSTFNAESRYRYTGAQYVALLPSGFGNRATDCHWRTSDPDRFWQEPSGERIFVFHDTEDSLFPCFLTFSPGKDNGNINVDSYNRLVVDSWNLYDDGNKCKLEAVP